MDFAWPRARVAVEVQGPVHYHPTTLAPIPEAEVKVWQLLWHQWFAAIHSLCLCWSLYVASQRRILESNGWTVHEIPYYAVPWDSGSDADHPVVAPIVKAVADAGLLQQGAKE